MSARDDKPTAGSGEDSAKSSFHGTFEIVDEILSHRLQQSDIQRLLSRLGGQDRDQFLKSIADILGKITALLDVSRQCADTLSLEILLSRMMEITAEALNAERSTLFLSDELTEELFSTVAHGGLKEEIRFSSREGIAGSVFHSGKAVIINDAYSDSRFNPEVDRKTGFRTHNILCAPILAPDGAIIGVTQLLNKKAGPFTPNDLTLLSSITSQASSALQNARLYDQVQRQKEEETLLLEVSTAISTELQLTPLLARIMETTTAILNADRSTLFLLDEKTGELWSQVAQGSDLKEIRFPSHLGIAGTSFVNRETINIPDAYSDARFNPEVDKKTGYRTQSILCMPILNKQGKAIGVTQVLNKSGGPFGPLDVQRLKAFSAQAAVAIENAKLFDDVVNIKNYNESMLQSMSNGVLTLDVDRQIVKINSAAHQLLKLEDPDIQGQCVEDVFTGPRNQWVLDGIDQIFKTRTQQVSVDTPLRLATGEDLSVNMTIVPLVNVKDEFIGSMLILEDITEEKRIKGTMARYMTKEVADKLLEAGGEAALGGQLQKASVLFSDIRDFTSISEQLGAPGDTVLMLNEYFTLMVDIIFEHQGILDKYIGDAIMAVFGAPLTSDRDADHSVRAAVDMMLAMDEFNRSRSVRKLDPIRIGLGINTDEVLSGNIGSLKRMDYTVIGDGVNLASRLEGVNKYYGTSILISEFTYRDLQDNFLNRKLDMIQVKGKKKPVAVYEILQHLEEKNFPNIREMVGYSSEGLTLYRQQRWKEAIRKFQRALSAYKDDGVSRVYLRRCQYLMENPPGEDWEGVWVLKDK